MNYMIESNEWWTEAEPNLNTIYKSRDLMEYSKEQETSLTIELKTLSPIGRWILNNRHKEDRTISTLSRVRSYYDTNYQRIFIGENSFDGGDKWVINYSCEIADIDIINKEKQDNFKKKSDKDLGVVFIIFLIIGGFILLTL